MTIFPKMFDAVLGESIIKRAVNKGIVKIRLYDLRDFTDDKHGKVDDKPFGGGAGMVMAVQPIYNALLSVTGKTSKGNKGVKKDLKVILLTPQGKRLDQGLANRLAKCKHLILICGHYEGVDERVRHLVTDEISIGDYVLTGGELPAMVVIDAITRLVPSVLGDEDSSKFDSFQGGLIEHPHYTRPRIFKDMSVPEVLLSGDHDAIKKWRHKEAVKRTKERRPDLLKNKN